MKRYWFYVFVWILILAILSSDYFSYYATRKIAKAIFEFFNPDVQIRTILKFHEIIRKALHVINFAVLSWLLLCAIVQSLNPISKWTIKAGLFCILICILYSITDEWRQSFTVFRTSSLRDIYLDTSGAILTQLGCWIAFKIGHSGKPLP